MTTTQLVLKGRDWLDIVDVESADLLIELLRDVNEEITDGLGGLVWFFQLGPDSDDPCLVAGVRGEVGSLHWYGGGQDSMIPVDGINPDTVDYWVMSGHEFPQDAGSELPIERVYEAVAEWVTTRARPTCVEWRDAR